MRKTLIIILVSTLLFFTFQNIQDTQARIDKEKYNDIFDKLYDRDSIEKQGVLVVDTVNDGNEKILFDGVTYDKKVFYSSLLKLSKDGKVKDRIKDYKVKHKNIDYQNIDQLYSNLDLLSKDEVTYKEIVELIESKDLLKQYKDFFKDVIPKRNIKDDRVISTLSSYLYETLETGYFEVYSQVATYYALYDKQAEYYLLNGNKMFTGNIRFLLADITGLGYTLHQSTVSFSYNPDGGSLPKPKVNMTLIIDYMGYQKMILIDTDGDESPYHISQETHYNRNMYNRVWYEDSPNHWGFGDVTEFSESELIAFGFTDDHPNYFHELLITDGFDRSKYKKEVHYYDLRLGKYTYGSLEAVLIDQENGLYIHDISSLRMATFNFGVARSEENGSEAHKFRDVYPYLVWGNDNDDYIEHSPYERFIWDKGSCFGENSFKILEGSSLINSYENDTFVWRYVGDQIPDEIIDSTLYLDFIAPNFTPSTYYFALGTVSNINWETYVSPTDNYTNPSDIFVNETYNNVNYYVPGSYIVTLELTDLVGNIRTKSISIRIFGGLGL